MKMEASHSWESDIKDFNAGLDRLQFVPMQDTNINLALNLADHGTPLVVW